MSEQEIGRLAMRHEGEYWNAYYALTDTMDDAVHLGSIRMGAVTGNPRVRSAFMDLMRSVVSDIITDKTGVKPGWAGEVSAPQHEKAGHA